MTRTIGTDESRCGRDDDGMNRHVGTETAFRFVHRVDAESDRVFHAAVDEAFHRDGEGGRTQYRLCSTWREFVCNLHITLVRISNRTDLVLHFDVARLVRLVENEQSHTSIQIFQHTHLFKCTHSFPSRSISRPGVHTSTSTPSVRMRCCDCAPSPPHTPRTRWTKRPSGAKRCYALGAGDEATGSSDSLGF